MMIFVRIFMDFIHIEDKFSFWRAFTIAYLIQVFFEGKLILFITFKNDILKN